LTKGRPLSFGLKTVINCFYGFAAVLTVHEEIILPYGNYQKSPETTTDFWVFFFYQGSVWCKFGASLLGVGTHAKKYLQTTQIMV
jgi:hypothetical protein